MGFPFPRREISCINSVASAPAYPDKPWRQNVACCAHVSGRQMFQCLLSKDLDIAQVSVESNAESPLQEHLSKPM